MWRVNAASKMAICKQASCSLLMLSVGLLFCFLLSWLAYFTYQSAAGNVVFCSVWTDIPGRIAILMSSYYIASICGYLPLPRICQPDWFRAPFTFWRFRSWYDLIKSCLPHPSAETVHRLRRNAMYARLSPLYREEQERFFNRMPIMRRRSAPVRITYPRSYVRPVNVPHSADANAAEKPQTPDSSNGSGESFMSFDSILGAHIVPMAKGRSSKPPYPRDSVELKRQSSKRALETMDEDSGMDEVPCAHVPTEADDNTSRISQDSEAKVLNYPVLNSQELPTAARAMNKKNINSERRKIDSLISFNQSCEKRRLMDSRDSSLGARAAGVDMEKCDDDSVPFQPIRKKRAILGTNAKPEVEARAVNTILTTEDHDFRTNTSSLTDQESTAAIKIKPESATGESSGAIRVCVDAGKANLEPIIVQIPKPPSPTGEFPIGLLAAGTALANKKSKMLASKRAVSQDRRGSHRTSKSTAESLDLRDFQLQILDTGDLNISHIKSRSESSRASVEFARVVANSMDTRGIPRMPILQNKVNLLRKNLQGKKRLDRVGSRWSVHGLIPNSSTEAPLGQASEKDNADVSETIPESFVAEITTEEQGIKNIPRSFTAVPEKSNEDSNADNAS